MKKSLGFAVLLLAVCSAGVQGAVVGEASPLSDGSVDGWSGITVMNGYGSLPAGEQVNSVNYYANAGRADNAHHVQPLIIKDNGTAATIWDIGPVLTPDAAGEHSGAWNSQAVPNDGAAYYAGFWQWNDGVDNTNGGVVAFGDSGGSGMYQFDADGTSYVPTVGDAVSAGHASGAGGRAYQFNLTTSVPEPATFGAAGAGLCLLGWLVRRRK